MVILTVLVLPLPGSMRRPLFSTYERIFKLKEVMTVVYISASLISLLFIDSLSNTWKYKTSGTMNPRNYKGSYSYGSEYSAKIFYNQRNLYIAGANLFLIIAIPTVFTIIRRLIKYEDLYQVKKNQEALQEEVADLQKENERLEKNVTALKSQKKGLERAYDDIVDKLNDVSGKASTISGETASPVLSKKDD
ncbi:hypothetical protein WICPIJ_000937 [Wickerhamomyces pijperi]|uniref:Endoplasmic reticulum transmembrane protein n=1 Tax=Wickerhamomyces pijperi TaxID=599730 RepID=A0A9P8QEN3_WICPI|nr:hypothetical protein WICPIJ_000937 [Wickerhamomyces pijperi]